MKKDALTDFAGRKFRILFIVAAVILMKTRQKVKLNVTYYLLPKLFKTKFGIISFSKLIIQK